MKAIERLETLLDEKDIEITKLQKDLDKLKDDSKRIWEWARHTQLDADINDLPLPRLEIRCENLGDWYNWQWTYSLVYKHVTETVVFVPLGSTKCGGSGRMPLDFEGKPDLPFREGVHIRYDAKNMNLPAFAIFEGQTFPLN